MVYRRRHNFMSPAPLIPLTELVPLKLTEKQNQQLIAFLKTLSGPIAADPKWLSVE